MNPYFYLDNYLGITWGKPRRTPGGPHEDPRLQARKSKDVKVRKPSQISAHTFGNGNKIAGSVSANHMYKDRTESIIA